MMQIHSNISSGNFLFKNGQMNIGKSPFTWQASKDSQQFRRQAIKDALGYSDDIRCRQVGISVTIMPQQGIGATNHIDENPKARMAPLTANPVVGYGLPTTDAFRWPAVTEIQFLRQRISHQSKSLVDGSNFFGWT